MKKRECKQVTLRPSSFAKEGARALPLRTRKSSSSSLPTRKYGNEVYLGEETREGFTTRGPPCTTSACLKNPPYLVLIYGPKVYMVFESGRAKLCAFPRYCTTQDMQLSPSLTRKPCRFCGLRGGFEKRNGEVERPKIGGSHLWKHPKRGGENKVS